MTTCKYCNKEITEPHRSNRIRCNDCRKKHQYEHQRASRIRRVAKQQQVLASLQKDIKKKAQKISYFKRKAKHLARTVKALEYVLVRNTK